MSRFNLIITFIALTGLLTACQPGEKAKESFVHAEGGAYTAALSEDGQFSLVSSNLHGISVWDLKRNALKYVWRHEGEDNLVLAADIADDNSVAVTADVSRFALWDMTTGESLGYWQIRDSSVRDVAISKNGRYVLIGKSSGVVVHVDIDTGRRIEFLGHQTKINSVDLSPNGRYALSGSNDYVAYLWDTQTGQAIYRFVHSSRVSKVALDRFGRYAFTADSKRGSKIWDLKTGEEVSNLKFKHRQNIFSAVRFSEDGRYLATGSPSRVLSLWDVSSGKRLQKWYVTPRKDTRPKSAVVYAVAFKDPQTLISESSSGLAEYWPITAQE
ncbi:WD40 repeat domain-containing protein [Corallincola platygyrae]|uniref:WD40 repeat domain-containing protein n=1 Tax=Corallincola platygyrae TaxID=1193278 RepID=A0ABW4XNM5_9GAMM